MNINRAMATIRKIDNIQAIEGADKIETAVIGGWTVVVKKGEFNPGDLCVYLEIDSWVPDTLAPFLTKPGHYPKEFNGVKGQRLRTVKLRGQLSQGLVLPLTEEIHIRFAETFEHSYEARYLIEGDNVTELLEIQKWEKPLAACLAGVARGNFPSEIPKTDQERIQNLSRQLEKWIEQGLSWEITEKLDGSSCTFYLDNDSNFHVCSRNLDLKESEDNAFWIAARNEKIEEMMRSFERFKGVAIQGELIGFNIQGNQYNLKDGEYKFYLFDMYDSNSKTYCPANIRQDIISGLNGKGFNIQHTPSNINFVKILPGSTVQDILEMAKGKSVLNPNRNREGLVFKCVEDPSISFKAINNDWLLENDG